MAFNFGGFDLTSGLSSLTDIGDKLQKLKEDVESSIDASLKADRSGASKPSEDGASAEQGDNDGDWLGFDMLRTMLSTGEEPVPSIEGGDVENGAAAEPEEGGAAVPLETRTEGAAAVRDSSLVDETPDSIPHVAVEVLEEPPATPLAIELEQQTLAAPQETDAAIERQRLYNEPSIKVAEQPRAGRAATQEHHNHVTSRRASVEAAATLAEGLEAAAAAVIMPPPPPARSEQPQQQQQPRVHSRGKEKRKGKAAEPKQQEEVVQPSTREPIIAPASAAIVVERAPTAAAPSAEGDPSSLLSTSEVSSTPAVQQPQKKDLSQFSKVDLEKMVLSLEETLRAREAQLERQVAEAASSATATAALVKKNEELVLAKAAVSEKDVADMRAEFERRLAAAERKAATLAKERDALRKNSSKGTEFEELLRQKDEEIQQIMEEGQALSKKQLTQETTIKQLKLRIRTLKEEGEAMMGRFENEQQRSTTAEREKEALASEIEALKLRHVDALSAERQHSERLLGEARTAAAVAEKKAEEAVKAGAARKLRDAEARVEALEATVEHLRDELERKRAAADDREDLLSSEVAVLQRRCAEAEARQQELQSKLPEATEPLLRQLEAMQAAADTAAAAAAESEKALQAQVATAVAAAAEARQAAMAAEGAIEEAEARVAASEERCKAAQEERQRAEAAAATEHKARRAAEASASQLHAEVAAAQESLATLEKVYAQQMEALQHKEAEAARAAAALREELRSRQALQQQHASQSRTAEPPAMAAPGFKWVMIKEGENGAGGEDSAVGSGSNSRGGGGTFSAAGAVAVSGEAGGAASNINGSNGTNELPGGASLWGGSSGGLVSALAAATRGSMGADPAALASMQRTIQDLEATRDRLSEELVRAEGEAAAGRATAARAAELELDVASLQQRYASAVEVLGEREERLEELAADIVEMREGYRQQVALLADEIERLRQRVLELETLRDP